MCKQCVSVDAPSKSKISVDGNVAVGDAALPAPILVKDSAVAPVCLPTPSPKPSTW